ncbi:hypothetical protein BDP55DRAFT_637960 [Colletotrichum godetiae]|uniref:Uncharacterized protein n=1 Tax=Colletotrichum godetiae TaxID=1209918 RepID=A0AAJ0AB44_9PEZI|nr:uncharacterized protein BDP55DRAFT_637960 [Colletotrichum godetiae]KAK1658331.1 hypothetical protein BDP55DRAFT_637960 [Colletotrichum godetiae]
MGTKTRTKLQSSHYVTVNVYVYGVGLGAWCIVLGCLLLSVLVAPYVCRWSMEEHGRFPGMENVGESKVVAPALARHRTTSKSTYDEVCVLQVYVGSLPHIQFRPAYTVSSPGLRSTSRTAITLNMDGYRTRLDGCSQFSTLAMHYSLFQALIPSVTPCLPICQNPPNPSIRLRFCPPPSTNGRGVGGAPAQGWAGQRAAPVLVHAQVPSTTPYPDVPGLSPAPQEDKVRSQFVDWVGLGNVASPPKAVTSKFKMNIDQQQNRSLALRKTVRKQTSTCIRSPWFSQYFSFSNQGSLFGPVSQLLPRIFFLSVAASSPAPIPCIAGRDTRRYPYEMPQLHPNPARVISLLHPVVPSEGPEADGGSDRTRHPQLESAIDTPGPSKQTLPQSPLAVLYGSRSPDTTNARISCVPIRIPSFIGPDFWSPGTESLGVWKKWTGLLQVSSEKLHQGVPLRPPLQPIPDSAGGQSGVAQVVRGCKPQQPTSNCRLAYAPLNRLASPVLRPGTSISFR